MQGAIQTGKQGGREGGKKIGRQGHSMSNHQVISTDLLRFFLNLAHL